MFKKGIAQLCERELNWAYQRAHIRCIRERIWIYSNRLFHDNQVTLLGLQQNAWVGVNEMRRKRLAAGMPVSWLNSGIAILEISHECTYLQRARFILLVKNIFDCTGIQFKLNAYKLYYFKRNTIQTISCYNAWLLRYFEFSLTLLMPLFSVYNQ